MPDEPCSHLSGLYIYLEHTNQTRLSYTSCIQPMGLKLPFLTDTEISRPQILSALYRSLPSQINGNVLSIIAVMADLYEHCSHASFVGPSP